MMPTSVKFQLEFLTKFEADMLLKKFGMALTDSDFNRLISKSVNLQRKIRSNVLLSYIKDFKPSSPVNCLKTNLSNKSLKHSRNCILYANKISSVTKENDMDTFLSYYNYLNEENNESKRQSTDNITYALNQRKLIHTMV
jgi:hypothetical protein